MILTSTTFEKKIKYSTQVTHANEPKSTLSYLRKHLHSPIRDVFVSFNNFNEFIDYELDLTSLELTKSSMELSSSSFSLEWNNEDDEYWNNYL